MDTQKSEKKELTSRQLAKLALATPLTSAERARVTKQNAVHLQNMEASESNIAQALENEYVVSYFHLMEIGHSSYNASQAVIATIMSDHSNQAHVLNQQMSLSTVTAAIDTDDDGMNAAMLQGVRALDENAARTNDILSCFCAGAKIHAPVVSSWTQSVLVGTGTGLRTDLVVIKADGTKSRPNDAREWRGFTGEALEDFLCTRSRTQWLSPASNLFLEPVHQALLQAETYGLLKKKATFDKFGKPEWKWVMSSIYYLRFMAALDLRELDGGDTAYKTNKIARLHKQVNAQSYYAGASIVSGGGRAGDGEDVDAYGKSTVIVSQDSLSVDNFNKNPIQGDHYAEVKVDELQEAIDALTHLHNQARVWEQIVGVLEDYADMQRWADPDSKYILDTELPDLDAISQQQQQTSERGMLEMMALAQGYLEKADARAKTEADKLAELVPQTPMMGKLSME